MKTYTKSIIPIIESNYNNLTQVEKNIADFFINNGEKINFSAKTISEKLFVSEASLSRFAKKCGYRGYREFIYQYEESFVEKNEFATSNIKLVLNTYQELLNKAYKLVDESQVARISNYLSTYRVFVCGIGNSGLAAKEMAMRFMRVGVDINAITDSNLIKMNTVFQNPNCLSIGISISGEKEEIIFFLKEAHKNGAKTVLITATNKDSFKEFCDEIVLVPTRSRLDFGKLISPQFPIAIMADIFYSCYTEQDKYKKDVMHDNTLKALKGNKQENLY